MIRCANINDTEHIATLIAQFRVELKQLKGITSKPNIESAKEEFQEYLEAGYPVFVAVDCHKELVGYMVCRIDHGVVWAEALYVDEKMRRLGIASKLYVEAEALAAERVMETVFNWVHPNNDKMITFLSKMGYDVLNLIEIRKPWKDEIFTRKIRIENHEYNY